jgi:hypothetical protein
MNEFRQHLPDQRFGRVAIFNSNDAADSAHQLNVSGSKSLPNTP